MSTTGLLTTIAGQAAILADLSGGANLVLSHVAFGDANGVPYNPVEAQTQLVRERYRCTIAAMGVTAGGLFVDAIIPADTNDALGRPSHGFNVAECALFSADGTLIALARMGNGFKPSPTSGQASIATYRLILACANPGAITVQVDPQAQVALGREVRPQWITVDGVINDPPANPAAGATYVIGAAPTGAWIGHAGKLAQWIGLWSISIAPIGHVVADNSANLDSVLRFLRYTNAGWVSAAGTRDSYGVTRRATALEVQYRSTVDAFLGPSDVRARLTGNTTFFVRADGDDANSGLVNSAAEAFKTLQGAATAVLQRYDPAGFTITFSVGSGTFAPATFDGWSSPVSVISHSGVAANTIISSTAGINGVLARRGARVTVANIKFAGSGTALGATNGGNLTFSGVEFANSGVHIDADYGGLVSAAGNYTILLGAANHWRARSGGLIVAQGVTINIPSPIAFTTFGFAVGSGSNIVGGSGLGFSGAGVAATTGQRFAVGLNAVIDLAGAGGSFLPGNSAGGVVTGGQYV